MVQSTSGNQPKVNIINDKDYPQLEISAGKSI